MYDKVEYEANYIILCEKGKYWLDVWNKYEPILAFFEKEE